MELYTRVQGHGPPLVLLHGLFGSNENLGGIARALADRFTIYAMDLRNHGRSPHGEPMDYPTLAGDVATTMAAHGLDHAAVLGHSMGGKAAMELALSRPKRVNRLVVLDIAPVRYDRHHDEELDALLELDLAAIGSRREADEALARRIPNAGVRQFLLKNLRRGETGFEWRLPLATIDAQYPRIAAAPPSQGPFDGPALFLRGSESGYVSAADQSAIHARFPRSRIETVEGTHHWLHVEKPEAVGRLIDIFLSTWKR